METILRAGPGAAKEDRVEPRFEQDGLPAESVEGLADIDEGNVEQPQRRPYGRREQCRVTIGNAGNHQAGEHDSEPGRDGEYGVLRREVKEARGFTKWDLADPVGDRQQSAFPGQRLELIDGVEECHQVNDTEATLEDQAGEPVTSAVPGERHRG